MERFTHRELLFLAALCLAAGVLRFHNLGGWAPCGDEVYTMVEARDFEIPLHLDHVRRWTLATNSLSHLCTGIAYTLMGESPYAARFPSALFGLLAVPVFYLLLRRIFGTSTALLAALFMTFSPNLVFLSGFARYNSMVFFFGGLSFLLCLAGVLEQRGGLFAWGVVWSLLAVLSHTTALFVPMVTALTALSFIMAGGEDRRFYVKALAGVLLPYLAAGLLLLHPLLWKARVIFRDFSGEGTLYSSHHLLASVAYNDGPVHFLAAFGAVYLGLRRRRPEVLATAGLWFLPLAVLLAASFFLRVGPRYLHAVLSGFYILAAVGADAMIRRFSDRGSWVKVAVPVFFLVWQVPLLTSHWLDGSRYDTLSTTRFLQAWHETHPEEEIYAEAHMVYSYLSGGTLSPRELPERLPDLLRTLEGKKSAVIVFPRQRGIPLGFRGREYGDWIRVHCSLLVSFFSRRFDFKRYEMDVYRYEMKAGKGDGGGMHGKAKKAGD